jgi:hypothetical protein
MDGILRRCVHPPETEQLIQEAHYGVTGGHFSTNKITFKHCFKKYRNVSNVRKQEMRFK